MDEIQKIQEENRQLRELVEDMDKRARMLIRRDIELRRAYEKLKSFDSEKSEFVSIAAHQLRTPLSAIKWSQQMLYTEELGPLSDEQKQMIEQSQHSVTRLVNMINHLLDADHLELDKDHANKETVDISKIANEVISDVKPNADKKGVILELIIPSKGVPSITANPERIKDILLNLTDNAVKYTPTGGTVTVKITVGEKMRIEVSDTGMGIPVQHQDKIFSRFARAENAKRVDADGSGLGLYIVKRIIDFLGGNISFTSIEGRGTTFVVQLPYNQD